MNNLSFGKAGHSSRFNTSDNLPKSKNEHSRKSNAKIDPQVYTDTMSKGLSSRVVLYYDRNHGAAVRAPQAKPIVNRMYNRVGDFPVVHFNKNGAAAAAAAGSEESLKRFRSSGSIGGVPSSSGHIKIPAPERSLYLTSSRSEILRTGSLTSPAKLVDESSRQQQHSTPLHNMHEPSQQLAPLEALKEISRKRINCDEMDGEHLKKQKSDTSATTTLVEIDQVDGLRSKRQREALSPNSDKQSQEVAKKKRPCYKNNDILSSLSSSISLAIPKRKILIPEDEVLLARTNSYEPQVVSAKRTEPPNRIPPTRNDETNVTEVCQTTSAPPRLTLFNTTYGTALPTSSSSQSRSNTQINIRDADNVNDHSDEDEPKISYITPRKSQSAILTTNKPNKWEKSKLSLMLSCLSGDLNYADDEVDKVDATVVAPVVAAVESHSKPSHLNPPVGLISTTTIPSVTTDSLFQSQIKFTTISEPIRIATNTNSTSQASKPVSFVTTSTSATTPTLNLAVTPTVSIDQTDHQSVIGTSPTTSSTPPISTPVSDNVVFGSTVASTIATDSGTATAPAVKAIFSFGTSSAQPSANVATTTIPVSSQTTKEPTFGSKPLPENLAKPAIINDVPNRTTTTTNFGESLTTAKPIISFGSSSSPSNKAPFSLGGGMSAPTFGSSNNGQIQFGGSGIGKDTNIKVHSKTETLATASTTASSFVNPPLQQFGFGVGNALATPTLSSAPIKPSSTFAFGLNAVTPTTTAAAAPMSSFGATAAPTTLTPNSSSISQTAASTGPFSFGAAAEAVVAAVPPSSLGSSSAFSFGTTAAQPVPTPSATSFPFSVSAATTIAPSAPASFSFGSSSLGTVAAAAAETAPKPVTTSSSGSFSFGNTNNNPTTAAAFSFGTSQMNSTSAAVTSVQSSTFAFGSSPTVATTTTSATTGAFQFGNSSNQIQKPTTASSFAFGGTQMRTAAPNDLKPVFGSGGGGSGSGTQQTIGFNNVTESPPVFGSSTTSSQHSNSPFGGSANVQQPSGAFNFNPSAGGSGVNTNATTLPSAFSFNAQQPLQQQQQQQQNQLQSTSNHFGTLGGGSMASASESSPFAFGTTMPSTAPGGNTAFNFTAQPVNLFAPGPGAPNSLAAKGRVIRHASRRVNK